MGRRDQGFPKRKAHFIISKRVDSVCGGGKGAEGMRGMVLLPDLRTTSTVTRRLRGVKGVRSSNHPVLNLSDRSLLRVVLSMYPRKVLVPTRV